MGQWLASVAISVINVSRYLASGVSIDFSWCQVALISPASLCSSPWALQWRRYFLHCHSASASVGVNCCATVRSRACWWMNLEIREGGHLFGQAIAWSTLSSLNGVAWAARAVPEYSFGVKTCRPPNLHSFGCPELRDLSKADRFLWVYAVVYGRGCGCP